MGFFNNVNTSPATNEEKLRLIADSFNNIYSSYIDNDSILPEYFDYNINKEKLVFNDILISSHKNLYITTKYYTDGSRVYNVCKVDGKKGGNIDKVFILTIQDNKVVIYKDLSEVNLLSDTCFYKFLEFLETCNKWTSGGYEKERYFKRFKRYFKNAEKREIKKNIKEEKARIKEEKKTMKKFNKIFN